MSLPVIDVSPLVGADHHRPEVNAVASEIHDACRDAGFFYIEGHGVDQRLQDRLERVARQFFELDPSQKRSISMERGGRAWRGYFAVGDELTSGRPDFKEGLYFGAEIPRTDPRVVHRLPLHGPNLFPESVPEMRDVVLSYIDAMTRLGHSLMVGLSLSLDLPPDRFAEFTRDPLILFRIFHYPPLPPNAEAGSESVTWGVGEHTDYGLLTMLKQDATGGLQAKTDGSWVDVPPLDGTFVCNIGDMLDRLTGGYYRSTPHRVLNRATSGRFSYPFFFDPDFNASVEAIDLGPERSEIDDRDSRWDRSSVHEFKGTYGDYLLAKVKKVFPDLNPH